MTFRADSARNSHLATVLVLLGTVASCGDALHPVVGVVLLDGEPLEGAHVYFHPNKGGPVGVDTTGQDGRFQVVTAAGDGVAAGHYTVTLSRITNPAISVRPPWVGLGAPKPTPEMQAEYEKMMDALRAKEREWIPEKYRNTSTTPLHFSVPSDKDVLFEIKTPVDPKTPDDASAEYDPKPSPAANNE